MELNSLNLTISIFAAPMSYENLDFIVLFLGCISCERLSLDIHNL